MTGSTHVSFVALLRTGGGAGNTPSWHTQTRSCVAKHGTFSVVPAGQSEQEKLQARAIKESKVPDCSNPSADDARCDATNLVSVGQVESFTDSLFDLPTAPLHQLSYLRDVSFFVDMTSDPEVGGAVEA